MNLQCFKRVISLSILIPVLLLGQPDSTTMDSVLIPTEMTSSSLLNQAYSSYLNGSFPESYKTYKSAYESDSNGDALYGMINSLAMMKKYDEAILLCHTAKDPILRAKEAWICGLADKKVSIEEIIHRLGESFSIPEKAIVLRSGGDGFWGSGNFREAVKWYSSAEKTEHDSLTKLALNSAMTAQKAVVTQTASAMGGPIIYSHNSISEQGNRYRYDKGSFFDVGSRWDIRKKQTIEVHYNRFDASFLANRFGINYESQLYKSLDNSVNGFGQPFYPVHDSITHWLANSEETNRAQIARIFDTSYGGPALIDTIWNLYSEQYLPGKNTAGFDTIISSTPAPIFQNSVYASLRVAAVNNHPLTLGGSVNVFQSNMENMNLGATLHLYDGHFLKYVTVGGNWYGTFTEKVGTLQASPEISGVVKKFSWRITPTYLWKLRTPELMNIPGGQLSAETELGLTSKHTILTGTAVVGKRAFVAESGGQNLVTVALPHKFTGSMYGAIMPGTGRFTIFTLLRYENYEQLSRLIALGGITLKF